MCLEGYRRQSFLSDFPDGMQLIVADDGSGPEIEEIFSKFADEVSFPTTFLHQDDYGWGKLRMLNWASLEALADRMIFTDGDCVPHRDFVRAHFENSKETTVYCGRRVDLMEKLTRTLDLPDVISGKMDSNFWLLKNIIKDEMDFGEQGFFLPQWAANFIPIFSKNSAPTLVGSNFSIHKKWLLNVNGFDESFVTPGIGEDTDLERRIKLIGLNLEWITYRAVQFHLWHPLTHVGERTHQTYESLKQKGNRTALKGINELQSELMKISSP